MQKKYGLININGDKDISDIYEEIQTKITNFLNQPKDNVTN